MKFYTEALVLAVHLVTSLPFLDGKHVAGEELGTAHDKEVSITDEGQFNNYVEGEEGKENELHGIGQDNLLETYKPQNELPIYATLPLTKTRQNGKPENELDIAAENLEDNTPVLWTRMKSPSADGLTKSNSGGWYKRTPSGKGWLKKTTSGRWLRKAFSGNFGRSNSLSKGDAKLNDLPVCEVPAAKPLLLSEVYPDKMPLTKKSSTKKQ